MKIFALLALLVCLAACGKIETFTNLSQQKIESEPAENEQPDVPPILEITENAQGSFNVIGKSLLFNLYENGIIEFEYADQKKLVVGKTYQAEEVNILQRAKISPEELQKFTDLLKNEDLWKTNDDYKRKVVCTDTDVDFKINFTNGFKQKNVNLNSYCDLYDVIDPKARYTGEFPQVLSNLMSLVDAARQKYKPQ